MINLFCLSMLLFALADETFRTSTDLWRDPTLQAIEQSGNFSYHNRQLRDDALLENVLSRNAAKAPAIKIEARSEAITIIQNKIKRIEQKIDYVNAQSIRLQKLNGQYQALGKSVGSNAAARTTGNATPDTLRWNELRGQMYETQAMIEKEGKRAMDEASAIRSLAQRKGLKINDILGEQTSTFRSESFSTTDRIFENKSDLESLQSARLETSVASEFRLKTSANQTSVRPHEGNVKVEGMNGTRVEWQGQRVVEIQTTFGESVVGRVIDVENAVLSNQSLLVRTYDLMDRGANVEVSSSSIAKINLRPFVPDSNSVTQLRPSNSMLSEAISLNKLNLADPAGRASSTFGEGVAGASMDSSARASQATR